MGKELVAYQGSDLNIKLDLSKSFKVFDRLFKSWPMTQCFISDMQMVIPRLEDPPEIEISAPIKQERMTYLQKKSMSMEKKTVAPVWAIWDGFTSGIFKPVTSLTKAYRGATGGSTSETEIYKLFSRYGMSIVKAGVEYVVTPEQIIELAEKEAHHGVEIAKAKTWDYTRRILTFQVNPLDAFYKLQSLHAATKVAQAEASTAKIDMTSLYLASYNYYTTTKLYNFLGGFIAGALLGCITKRYVSKPSERFFGPTFSKVASIVTTPVRPILPRAVAMHFGRMVAARSPAALIMMLSWMGTFYSTRDEFEELVVSTKNEYPEIYSEVISKLDETQRKKDGLE